MSHLQKLLFEYDEMIAGTMQKYGFLLLRYSLALVFIWFGMLKPLGLSPAADLVASTAFWLDPEWFIPVLGWWEVLIGVLMLFKSTIRLAILLLFLQMPGTFMPIFILPDVVFTSAPFGLTIEGQYIIKNMTLIAAAIAIGGTVNRPDSEKELH